MNNLHPRIAEEYRKWHAHLGPDEPFIGANVLGIQDVMRAHFLIADFFAQQEDPVGLIGPRDLGLLQSALGRQVVSFGGADKWQRDVEVIATLFFGLIKNHPFHDGNKRTALLCSLYHMMKCHLTPTVGQRELEAMTLAVADSNLAKYPRFRDFEKKGKGDAEVHFLAQWFRNGTRRIDKRFYAITYRDLQTILNRHGFFMEEPRDNHIDIVQYKTVTKLLFRKETRRVKICQIGFPKWTAQVGQGAIGTVRKATGLTPENGCDSQSFYNGLDDMRTLIDLFSGPLMRLKDK